MRKESKTWLSTFLAGFLATVLGIVLTFGLESLISSSKRTKTARLLAGQIVDNMDRTYHELHELNEYNIFYSRMQNVRASLDEIGQSMSAELEACRTILTLK